MASFHAQPAGCRDLRAPPDRKAYGGPVGPQGAQGPAGLLASPNGFEGLPGQSPNGPGTTEAVVDRAYGSHPGTTTPGSGYNGMGSRVSAPTTSSQMTRARRRPMLPRS